MDHPQLPTLETLQIQTMTPPYQDNYQKTLVSGENTLTMNKHTIDIQSPSSLPPIRAVGPRNDRCIAKEDPDTEMGGLDMDPSTVLPARNIEMMDVEDKAPSNQIRTEWVGTSQVAMDEVLDLQYQGDLDMLISYRKALAHDIKESPYDPALFIELSRVDTKLGFCDVALATAYRGLILVKAGLEPFTSPSDYRYSVRKVVSRKVKSSSAIVIDDELSDLLLKMYREFINGFLGTAAFWDGLVETKTALKLFPTDPELLEMQRLLKEAFEDRLRGMKDLGGGGNDIKIMSTMGKIYQKAYPWLNKKLAYRTPALLKSVNARIGAGNCEVRPVIFGPIVFGPEPPKNLAKGRVMHTRGTDVGPLGIFATCDIKEGDIIMADKCLTGVSQIPSSCFEHCDACHASLAFPFVHPNEIIKPSCCGKVAFCSLECYDQARDEYHDIVCGKDFDWLYENIGKENHGHDAAGTRWRPIMFLRVMAIILQDQKFAKLEGNKPDHPLQHPLIARMAANYAPPEKNHPDHSCDWQFFENVAAPTRVLMELGVNVFTATEFTPEAIQTIYWRMENNANMSTFNLNPLKPSCSSPSRLKLRKMPQVTEEEEILLMEKATVHMVCLNPNYLFFNHSCEPNVSWHGSIPDPSVGIDWLRGLNGEIHKPGSSAVFCKAGRNIKEGEELKISYIGDPMGRFELKQKREFRVGVPGAQSGLGSEAEISEEEKCRRQIRLNKRRWMEKWFPGGCGCRVCQEENEIDEKLRKKSKLETGQGEKVNELWDKVRRIL